MLTLKLAQQTVEILRLTCQIFLYLLEKQHEREMLLL